MALIFKESPPPKLNHKLDTFAAKTLEFLVDKLGRDDGKKLWFAGQKIYDLNERAKYYAHIVIQLKAREEGVDVETPLREYAIYKHKPVGIREFLTSPDYLDKGGEIYPAVLDSAEELNNGQYVEAVLTGGIGSGKTTLALYTNVYQLYLLSCMRNPHKVFGLDPSSEILFIFQSITKQLSKGLDYDRYRSMVESSPYFKNHFPFRKDLESELHFPHRIIVRPVSGSDTAAIGQNVIGGLIDELNYMAVVEKSKASVDQGTYDQAVAVYNSIARRRKTRFMERGKMPGILCLVSSKKYPGQFTDVKIEEASRDKTIFVYDKRVWDIKPESYADKGWFTVFVGDLSRKPRILKPEEEVDDEDRALVVSIPEDYREDFQKDIINALREIAGVSTLARHPFFVETDKIGASFRKDQPSIFAQSVVDFVQTRLTIRKGAFYKPDLPRFVHVDLAISGDSAGLAIGCVTSFKKISTDTENPAFMPDIRIDGTLQIRPPKNSEILFGKIRDVLFTLRKMDLNIRWVTFDTFQSTDSQQILRQKGFVTGPQSMDLVPCIPYDFLKAAVYDGRVRMPSHEHLQTELVSLEKDTKTAKVDHPPRGCFAGETRVALANGTCPTFKELAESYKPGDIFYVYSIGPEGVRIAPAHSPRITKHTEDLVEILLDNFQVIRCTPEHLFMTLNREWVQAQNLTPDISIMPLYRSISYKGGWGGYERIWCPVREQRLLTHQLAYRHIQEGEHVHHKNENKRDNDPRNLEALNHNEHCKHHGILRWDSKKESMKQGFQEYYKNGGSIIQSDLIKQLWSEGKFGGPKSTCAIEDCNSLSDARGLCGKHYQLARRAGTLPDRTSAQKNHRVLSISKVQGVSEPVYDLTVPGTENFALASGVFVHNSKDVADALAGVVYGLTMRREIWGMYGIPTVMVPSNVSSGKDNLKMDSQTPTYQGDIEEEDPLDKVRRRLG